ncbi:hypothetical protein KSP39_PZI012738 [Platanthera zijinensis]|uniref:Lactate/malate dehydrogenase C-terminal domain-containing protein n=1 Tax=Platanthera zijinensis TaxID=2320716 RepID=A0AAP0G4R4_9ASPA
MSRHPAPLVVALTRNHPRPTRQGLSSSLMVVRRHGAVRRRRRKTQSFTLFSGVAEAAISCGPRPSTARENYPRWCSTSPAPPPMLGKPHHLRPQPDLDLGSGGADALQPGDEQRSDFRDDMMEMIHEAIGIPPIVRNSGDIAILTVGCRLLLQLVHSGGLHQNLILPYPSRVVPGYHQPLEFLSSACQSPFSHIPAPANPHKPSSVRLGKNGVEEVLGLGSLSDFEKEGLDNLKTELKASIEKGIKFVAEN